MKKRWNDTDVTEWAGIFIGSNQRFDEMETSIGVPHSTIWWCLNHRLPKIDYDLYGEVLKVITKHKGRRGRRKKL